MTNALSQEDIDRLNQPRRTAFAKYLAEHPGIAALDENVLVLLEGAFTEGWLAQWDHVVDVLGLDFRRIDDTR